MDSNFVAQLGVMSQIDRWRSENDQIMTYLNEAEQRSKLEQEIRAHYKREGVDIPDDVLSECIGEWFSSRLKFKPVKLSWFDRVLLDAVQNIDNYLGASLLSGFFIGVFCSIFYLKIDLGTVSRDEAYEDVSVTLMKNASSKVINDESLDHYPMVRGNRLRLTKMVLDLQNVASTFIESDFSQDKFIQMTKEVIAERKSFEKFFAAVARFEQIKSKSENHVLANLSSKIIESLNGDGRNYEYVYNDINTMIKYRDDYERSVAEKADYKKMYDRALAALTNGHDKIILDSLYESINSQIDEHKEYRDLVSRLKYFSEVADKKIVLSVVSIEGEKSIVKRSYNNGGGKYYAIVQARDDIGNKYNVFVESSETGKNANATIFGIEISESVFERIKNDKISDGVVDDKVIGVKEKGQITFDLKDGISENYILNW